MSILLLFSEHEIYENDESFKIIQEIIILYFHLFFFEFSSVFWFSSFIFYMLHNNNSDTETGSSFSGLFVQGFGLFFKWTYVPTIFSISIKKVLDPNGPYIDTSRKKYLSFGNFWILYICCRLSSSVACLQPTPVFKKA